MKIAVVRIRGIRKIKPKIEKALQLLNLEKPNYCVVIDDSKSNLGMLEVVKDYVAFGKIDNDTIFRLIYKEEERAQSG